MNLLSCDPVSISVVFPCYNEAGNVVPVVTAARDYLQANGHDFEILIVNDGSTDKTGELADALAKEDPHIKVIHHPQNRGAGAALRTGFHAAGKEWVFYTDTDGQFDISELPKVLALRGEFDIVSGYRLNRQDNHVRRAMGWGWTTLMDVLFGLNLRDIDCAYKLFRQKIFRQIELKGDGAFLITEVLVRAIGRGYRLTQVGVTHYPRRQGTASGGRPAVIWRAFRELRALRREVKSESRKNRR